MRTTSRLATQGGPVGGVRRRDEDRGQFYQRMASRKAGGMASQGAGPFTSRQANIAAARADGTFDAKRNAFNASNAGSYMDSQGNIGPKAPPLPGTSTAARPFTQAQKFASAPDGQGGYKQVPILAAGASPSPKTATGPMGPFKPRPKDAPFTSMQLGSRELYAEEKKQEETTSPMAAASPSMKPFTSLGKAAKIANSRETAAVMAKAKASLPSGGMVASASARPAFPDRGEDAFYSKFPDRGEDAAAMEEFYSKNPAARPSSGRFRAGRSAPKPTDPPVARHIDAPIPKKKVVAARAKGGPVTAGKPYLVGEKGPEIIVPKNSGMVIPNHKITPPALDKLANQGKMATLPHARTPASIVSAASAGSQPSDPQAGQKWLNKWDEKVASKEEAARDEDVVREEKRLGLPSLKKLRTGKPQNQWEEVKVGLEEGVTKIGQTVAGIGSMVNLPGAETRRKMYADRASTMESYRKRGAPDVGLSAGDIASSAVKEAPEWVNPFSAPGKIAKAGNAVYHAARSYAPNKSYIDAAMGSASNVIGEKAEDLVTKGKGLFGNAIGSVIENGTNYVRGEEKPKKRKGPFMSAASN